jgi:hypothetical protein
MPVIEESIWMRAGFGGIRGLFEMKSECQKVYVDLRESKY